MVEPKPHAASHRETSRIEAFSDGVFSIAITLLILEIHVPAVQANETMMQSPA